MVSKRRCDYGCDFRILDNVAKCLLDAGVGTGGDPWLGLMATRAMWVHQKTTEVIADGKVGFISSFHLHG